MQSVPTGTHDLKLTEPSGEVSIDPSVPRPQRTLQASRIPSSRIGRLFHYGGLAASLGYGAAFEALRRTARAADAEGSGSLMLTPANVQRLVDKLSKMRGAALKLGQFLSIQGKSNSFDTSFLSMSKEEK